MFRALTQVASTSLRAASRSNVARPGLVSQVRLMSGGGKVESDAEFDARYIAYFDRKDIDGWEIRKVSRGKLSCCFVTSRVISAIENTPKIGVFQFDLERL